MTVNDKPSIPKWAYEKILGFMKTGGTGQAVIDFHQGRIRKLAIASHFRPDESDPVVPIEVQHPPALKTR